MNLFACSRLALHEPGEADECVFFLVGHAQVFVKSAKDYVRGYVVR